MNTGVSEPGGRAGLERLRQNRREFVGGKLHRLHELFHERVVGFDGVFDGGLLEVFGFAGGRVHHRGGDAGEGGAFAVVDDDGHALRAEGFLYAGEDFLRIDVFAVHAGDDEDFPEVVFCREIPRLPRHEFDAALGVHADDGGVGGGEAGNHAALEVHLAGGVDDVDFLPRVGGVHEGGGKGVAVFLLLFFKVGDRGAVGDRTEAADSLRPEEHGFCKNCFSRSGVAAENDVPDVGGCMLRHEDSISVKRYEEKPVQK